MHVTYAPAVDGTYPAVLHDSVLISPTAKVPAGDVDADHAAPRMTGGAPAAQVVGAGGGATPACPHVPPPVQAPLASHVMAAPVGEATDGAVQVRASVWPVAYVVMVGL